jgi:spore coat polysaccharide biosynthesis protein SpsF (cytidylyltransferase family)
MKFTAIIQARMGSTRFPDMEEKNVKDVVECVKQALE